MPNMAVFYSSLVSCFSGTLLRYFMNYFDMAPVVPYFYLLSLLPLYSTCAVFLLYGFHILKIFDFFLDRISFPEIAMSNKRHVFLLLLLLLLYVITIMQGIDNYTPKPNQISRIYNVAALLWFNL